MAQALEEVAQAVQLFPGGLRLEEAEEEYQTPLPLHRPVEPPLEEGDLFPRSDS